MRLGTETGSLTNHVLSRATIGQPVPVVGMGATLLYWTDRHAATIVEVVKDSAGRTLLTVQEDAARRTDENGQSENQDWVFEPNPNGERYTFRQESRGAWVQVRLNAKTKRFNISRGPGLRIGERASYLDPSF